MADDFTPKPHATQLRDELKTNEYVNQFENWNEVVDDVLKLREEHTTLKTQLEQAKAKQENLIRIPDENASEEDLAAYRRALGVPDDVEAYKIVDKEHEMDAFADESLLTGFKETAFKAGLTQEQAGVIAEFVNSRELAKQKGSDESRAKARQELEKQLYDKYKDELPKETARLREFLLHYGPKSGAKLLQKFNLDNDYEITTWLMEFADQFAEDKLPKGGVGGEEPQSKGILTYASEGMD